MLKTIPGQRGDFSKVCKARDVFNKIEEFEQTYRNERMDHDALAKIGEALLERQTPKPVNILKVYNLTEKDIRTGVCCPKETCRHIPMHYKRGKWTCPNCQQISKEAHLEAISDYFYIINQTITNSKLRSFLHLPSSNTTQKVLFRLNLPSTGKTSNRIYELSSKKVPTCVLP